MRTVTFKSVLNGVATRMGLEPDANLQLNQATALTEYIGDRTTTMWELAAWPEWTTSEQRQFREDWDVAVTYAAGAEVYYADQNAYYRSLQSANLGHVPAAEFETEWWETASDLNTYIVLDQSWEANVIGEIWDVYLDDPRKNKSPRRVGWWRMPEGIWVDAGGATKVFVEFSLLAPLFTTVEWDAAVAYVPGDLVYYYGDCYQARTASTAVVPLVAGDWRKQAFPYVLARPVKLAAIADALREDENINKALGWDAQADNALNHALERACPAMRATGTYGTGQ